MRKKTINLLKALRVVLAAVIFMPILLFFADFTDTFPDTLSKLLEIQLLPAILTGTGITLAVYFLLTLFFGRIYCSVICPAGILQDLFNRISCMGGKKQRKKKKIRFHYHKPANLLRYIILGITAVTAVAGMTELCLLLDPYSNFGRIATNIFRPVAVWINNILAGILSSNGIYSLYNVTVRISAAAFISATIALAVFSVMAFFRGRLFCNTICPVGTLLSIVSRYSLFRITFDKNKCNKCSLCEKTCKAEAIDSKNMTVDASRCVTCFNCTSACNRKSLKYAFAPASFKKNPVSLQKEKGETVSASRRSFITTSAVIAGSIPLSALAKGDSDRESGKSPLTPPGSLNINRFKDLCTGCHLCVVQCPTHVLHPAGLKFGLGYMLKPYMSYEDSYCNYSCTVCSEVCPTDAIKPITPEDKKTVQIGVANFHRDLCVVYTEENDCGACSEHCPSQAVHMIPYKGTLTIPKVESELCIGCGGCESICPVRPARAIVIVANVTHKTAELPKEEAVQEVEVDDFGF
ncbi:MAG: 4Fe-4S binding protein [Tannerella sp.]|jgi:polyferredoxin|nr:4Fe-4S binding protein [Tannerella sp.]